MAPRSCSPSPSQPPHNSNAAYIDKLYGSVVQAQSAGFGTAGVMVDSPDIILHI